jgi:NADH-quinone oxidoreductase subunit M
MTGSAIFLVGIVGLGVAARTFDLVDLASKPISESAQTLLAALFLAAFVVKLPLFPFHAWLPRAYLAAPIPVAIVLSGIVAKTAAFGIVHLCVALFPLGMLRLAPFLVSLAAVGALYGALLAFRQRDTRGIIAFASLSHLNLIGLGAFSASHTSLEGVAVASVSHGLVVAALFLLASMLALRTGGFELDRAGGLGASAPILAALFTLAVVAAIGVPGTSGFAGEVLILAGSYLTHPVAAAVATATVVVAAIYGLRLLRLAFFGPATITAFDLRLRERLLLAPVLALVLLVGLVPSLVTDRIDLTGLGPHAQVVR